MRVVSIVLTVLLALTIEPFSFAEEAELTLPNRSKFDFVSTVDKTKQSAYWSGPTEKPQSSVPLVVSLHSWSADFEQRQPELENLVVKRSWFCLQPNFRGTNDNPLACASPTAQQDILDAVNWAIANHPIDPKRIYLTGNSGGGHMTMMMAARFPKQWRAASAWVGISDLASWHEMHRGDKYGEMTRQVCGGAPGDSPLVDEQYRIRSPITFLNKATSVPLDIAAGIHDGHTGSVPIRHSLDAFNVIATSVGAAKIGEEEIQQLSKKNGRLKAPTANDEQFDRTFDRQLYLRRIAGNSRVSIFEGGHEGIATATMAWFDAHP